MMKQFLPHILASSLLLAGTVSQVYADANLPSNSKRIQRSFVNLSFEKLLNGVTHTSNGYKMIDQKNVDGWNTTASMYDNTGALINRREMELWRKGTGTAQPAQQGDLYSELNGHEAATLYQNICLLDSDEFNWSMYHMGRQAATEKMAFVIGNEVVDNGLPAALPFTTIATVREMTAVRNQWTLHESTAPVQAASLLGGASAKVVAFGFQATEAGKFNEGNFLDNIKIKLKPAVEFSAASGLMFENENSVYHPINFKIVGLLESDLDVSFVIDNASVANPAVHGQDYKIYKVKSDGTYEQIALDETDPLRPAFKYKVTYNAALDYANGVTVSGLVVKIENNDLLDGDKVIPFGLSKIQSGAVSLMGTEVCGNTPISTFTYEIKDDDADLALSKTLNEKGPLPNDTVSYDLILENKSKLASSAENVVLKDELLANLVKDANTELSCTAIENEGVTGICPVFTSAKDAAVQLFSAGGLSLGSIPAKSKFKFTLSKLKVASSDLSPANYAGLIVNKASVTTTSNDIDPTNNEATATDLYAAENDLFNNDAGKTGTGLFVIDNGGQPLWTQAAADKKAFFPLKIKNSAKLQQEYQLHASRTAVNKSRTDSNLSPLAISSIQPYTDQLKIEFFETSSAQCKAGLSGAKQVTQLSVAANAEAEVCAVITILESAQTSHDIWFAIESLQSGLGDVIRDAVTTDHLTQRLLELVNDQTAQVNVGGTYVFPHRLINHGSVDEQNITFTLTPVRADDFLYTLFQDTNNNGELDSADIMISNQSYSLLAKAELALLIKVQAPATASNGMSSQVKLEAKPDNSGQSIILATLSNIDSITVGANQVQVHKTQLKRSACVEMDAASVKNAVYSVSNVTMGGQDCLVYRITVTNIGDTKLTDVAVNDMYPAYTLPWKSGSVLPMTSSSEAVQDDGSKVKTIFSTLMPQEQKSLYFGIKMQ